MRIGYTILGSQVKEMTRLKKEGNCDEIIALKDVEHPLEEFVSFMKLHAKEQVVVVSLESIGLQFSQFASIVELIYQIKGSLHFIDKELPDDQEYLSLLYRLSTKEKLIVSHRTLIGLEMAKKKGRYGGRPTIDETIAEQIQRLFITQKKSLREISEICGVSLGTAHKYTRLAKEEQAMEQLEI